MQFRIKFLVVPLLRFVLLPVLHNTPHCVVVEVFTVAEGSVLLGCAELLYSGIKPTVLVPLLLSLQGIVSLQLL